MHIIKKINPINKEEERKKFLFDQSYNPQFEYEHEFTQEQYYQFGQISDRHVDQALSIMDTVMKKFGSEDSYLDEVEGEVMTKEEVEQELLSYIKLNNIDNQFKFQFSRKVVSRTSMDEDLMTIRLPVDYRKKSFLGILHHEIGSHYFRRLNERESPWYKQHKKFGFSDFMETEEGLAVINQMFMLEHPYFWISSVYYVSTWWASQMSFADLNAHLKKYIQDIDRRWKMCLRIKRGLTDTSKPGAFSRNQNYFSGILRVLHYLEEHEYNPKPLYIGKVDIKDVDKAKQLAPDKELRIPAFLEGDLEEYKKGIMTLKKTNFPKL